MDLPEAVAAAPYIEESIAAAAVTALQQASYTELAHALASTSIAPTTVARIIALNKRVNDSSTLNDNLEILSLARQLASDLLWTEAEFVSGKLEALLKSLAQFPSNLLGMVAIVLFELAKSHDNHYGSSKLSTVHTLLLSPAIVRAQPSYALKVASIPRLGLSRVLRPLQEDAQQYFLDAAELLVQKKLYIKALQAAMAAVPIRGSHDGYFKARRIGILLLLIVSQKATPLPSYIRGQEGRACSRCNRIASLYESTRASATNELKEYIASEQESLQSFGLGFLLDDLIVAHEIKTLVITQKVYRRCAWTELSAQSPVDTLVFAGYQGQLYETTDKPLMVEAGRQNMAELYELLGQVVEVAELSCGTALAQAPKASGPVFQFQDGAFTFGDRQSWAQEMDIDDNIDASE